VGGGEWVSNPTLSKPKEYRIRFANPDGSGTMIEWRSQKKSPQNYPEKPMSLDVDSGQLVIFTLIGVGPRCEMYNKYVYRNGIWIEEALPEKFEPRQTNLYFGGLGDIPKLVDLETKRKIKKSGFSRKAVRQVGPNREICE